jgi:hypothetical protein
VAKRRSITHLPAGTTDSATATGPVTIDTNTVYTLEQAQRTLGLKRNSLRREVREGRLSVSKRCGRYYFLGEQLLAWLKDGERRRPGPANRSAA